MVGGKLLWVEGISKSMMPRNLEKRVEFGSFLVELDLMMLCFRRTPM